MDIQNNLLVRFSDRGNLRNQEVFRGVDTTVGYQ